jgi:hypothetical protein
MSSDSRPVVRAHFTIGFGNNLFQYAYARLLAIAQDAELQHSAIPELNIPASDTSIGCGVGLPTMVINDKNASMELLCKKYEKCNYEVSGYFENYKFYKPFLHEIRSWFSPVEKQNEKDLIVHMRLQNRLVQANHHKNFISSAGYERAISKFDFERLHIVTDAEKWAPYGEKDIKKIRKEVLTGPNLSSELVPISASIDYINELFYGLSKYNPVVHCNGADMICGSGALRSNFIDDFNLIRSFDKIVVFNSTFAWWAACLSDASHIATYKPWKPNKGPKNKNLGLTDYDGWFSWE